MPATPAKAPWSVASIGLMLALAIIYIVVAKISLIPAPTDGNTSPIWPATGLGIAALLILGLRFWPFITIGAFATVMSTQAGFAAAAIIAVGNTLESVVAVFLLQRLVGFDRRLEHVRDVVWLMVLGGLIAPIVSTVIGVAALRYAGQVNVGISETLIWWSGNVAGCLLAAPLLLSWLGEPLRRPTALRLLEAIALAACVVVIGELVFGFVVGVGSVAYPLTFAIFPPLVWASIRFGHRGASSVACVFALMAVVATLAGAGPFSSYSSSVTEKVAFLSAFIFAISATGMVLSAPVRERMIAAQAPIAAEAKYHSLIEQASDGIFVSDLEGRYVEANTRGVEMLGYTVDELKTMKLQDVIVIDDLDRTPPRTNELHTGQHVLSERRLRRKDGSIIAVEISAKKLRDGRFLGIVRDVSERKRADRQRTLMMRELDHRVKNNLAIVLSIADQTARSVASVPEFSERFVGRIMALARVHGLLAQSSWTGADLATLIHRTLKPYAETQYSRLRIAGDACRIPSRATGPLCMTLHELATNAAKYGAFSNANGAVEVTWSQFPGPNSVPHIQLIWCESGGPAVAPPERLGFGTQLIEHGMAHEIGAEVKLEFRPAGVWCQITFSLVVDPKAEPDQDVSLR